MHGTEMNEAENAVYLWTRLCTATKTFTPLQEVADGFIVDLEVRHAHEEQCVGASLGNSVEHLLHGEDHHAWVLRAAGDGVRLAGGSLAVCFEGRVAGSGGGRSSSKRERGIGKRQTLLGEQQYGSNRQTKYSHSTLCIMGARCGGSQDHVSLQAKMTPLYPCMTDSTTPLPIFSYTSVLSASGPKTWSK